jgi:hypothetical protein
MVRDVFGFNPKSYIPEELLMNLEIAMEESRHLTSDPYEMAHELGENISDFIREISSEFRY